MMLDQPGRRGRGSGPRRFALPNLIHAALFAGADNQ